MRNIFSRIACCADSKRLTGLNCRVFLAQLSEFKDKKVKYYLEEADAPADHEIHAAQGPRRRLIVVSPQLKPPHCALLEVPFHLENSLVPV